MICFFHTRSWIPLSFSCLTFFALLLIRRFSYVDPKWTGSLGNMWSNVLVRLPASKARQTAAPPTFAKRIPVSIPDGFRVEKIDIEERDVCLLQLNWPGLWLAYFLRPVRPGFDAPTDSGIVREIAPQIALRVALEMLGPLDIKALPHTSNRALRHSKFGLGRWKGEPWSKMVEKGSEKNSIESPSCVSVSVSCFSFLWTLCCLRPWTR